MYISLTDKLNFHFGGKVYKTIFFIQRTHRAGMMGTGCDKVTHMVIADVHKQSTSTSTGAAYASSTSNVLKVGAL